MPDSPPEPLDLVEFVDARLDEDERWARAAGWHRWTLGIVYGTVMAASNGKTVARDCREYDAEHIVRHDPARVLREVEAKRRIVSRYAYRLTMQDDAATRPRDWDDLTRHYHEVVLDLVAAWSDHPDCRPEWSPSDG